MRAEGLEKRFGVTSDELDSLAAPFEQGKWPKGKTSLIGRPRLSDEEVRPVTFKLPVSQIAALDKLAKATGSSRSDTLRRAVTHELARSQAG